MNYSKKQLQPLIDKFQINPETNKLFIGIIEMFDNQPNYQVWAVKMIFNKIITIDELKMIHDWADANKTMIKLLEKKNIVSYTSKSDFAQLKNEMEGIKWINIVKNTISHFNTDQRKILNAYLFKNDVAAKTVVYDYTFMETAQNFEKFNRLSDFRKQNFFTKCSGIRNAETILSLVKDAIKETYKWDKEDMLVFLDNNCKNCDIVFNQGPYVVVYVPDFESSKKLCGGGRTEWCLTMQEHHFRDYVPSGAKQYFLFDFTRKETDPFAHIGFTIQKGRGIIYAQTCDNKPMINDFDNGQEVLNIYSAIKKIGAQMGDFISLKSNGNFQWDLKSIVSFVKNKPNLFSIAYNKDKRIIVNVMSSLGFEMLVGHTMIDSDDFWFGDDNSKVYVMFDLNLGSNNDSSIVAMCYSKDIYGSFSSSKVVNIFGKDIKLENHLHNLGIKNEDFLGRENIALEVKLHKLINEGYEDDAIKLVQENSDKIDVNFEFNGMTPIFPIIYRKMFNLYEVIISHPKFDYAVNDGYGETVLESILYLYGGDEINANDEEAECLKKLIEITLGCKNFDFNVKDINDDTALSIACEFPKLSWVVESLVMNPNVDVNTINAFDLSPIETAMENNNSEAVKALLKRQDISIRQRTKSIAKQRGYQIHKDSESLEMAMSLSV